MKRRKLVLAAGIVLLIATLSIVDNVCYASGHPAQIDMSPTFSENPNEVIFQTSILTAIIEKDRPMITFYYQPDRGNTARFRVLYNSIIAFNDTGDGIFHEDESIYEGSVSSGGWVSSPVVSYEDDQQGRTLMFSMNMSVTMTPAGSRQGGHGQEGKPLETVADWATMVLTFILTNKTYTREVSNQFAYNITGNVELKIDIEMIFHKDLPAKNITIEQFLYENEDFQQNHVFHLHESTGVEVRSSRSRDMGFQGLNMHQFSQVSQLQQRIAFATSDGIEEGYYSWIPPLNTTSDGGIKSVLNGSASYGTSGSELRLYYSLPYSPNYQNMNIDPVVGIIEAGFLQAIASFIVEHSNSLIAGGVIGVIVAIGILLFSSRRESKREEGSVDLEHNPYYSKGGLS